MTKAKPIGVSCDKLRELLDYDPFTGIFTWRVDRGSARAGTVAGAFDRSVGYYRIMIDGKNYRAHRLAWLWAYGYEPPAELDHRNRDPSDNRLENLRDGEKVNPRNKGLRSDNSSSVKGVDWRKREKKWRARIRVGSKRIELGLFGDLEKAAEARKAAEIKYWGENY
jgi:hypothetical protein